MKQLALATKIVVEAMTKDSECCLPNAVIAMVDYIDELEGDPDRDNTDEPDDEKHWDTTGRGDEPYDCDDQG